MESEERGAQPPEEKAGSRESDQLPEEHPSSAVPDDVGDGPAREDAEDNAGVPGEEGQATGHPDNAG